jgi:acyl-CoA thioesterase
MSDDQKILTQREEIERWWRDAGSPLNKLLDMHLVSLGDGEATFEAFPSAKFYNPQARAHGGYAATLLDSAMGCAIFSRLGKVASFGTIELKVNYVRGIFAETGRLTCTGKVIHFGRRIQTAEARIIDSAGKLYAHGSGTFMVYTE